MCQIEITIRSGPLLMSWGWGWGGAWLNIMYINIFHITGSSQITSCIQQGWGGQTKSDVRRLRGKGGFRKSNCHDDGEGGGSRITQICMKSSKDSP